MIDETSDAFDDRAAFGSFLGDLFKASPAGHLQREVGQQVADKIAAQNGGLRAGSQQIADLARNMTPSALDLAKGLGKTALITAPALIAVAAPVAVPALASALGYAAPTATETGLAGVAATSAVVKPALNAIQGARGAVDTSGLPVPAVSSTGVARAGAGVKSVVSRASSVATPGGSGGSGGVSPASTSSRDALANLLVSVARQVPGVAPASAGTVHVTPGPNQLVDLLAGVAKQALPGAPLPASVASRVSFTPPASTAPNPGLLHQTGFAPVLGVAPKGQPAVRRATPSIATTIAKSIDVKGLPASITNAVLWTVTAAGQVARGHTVIASSLPQWLIYSSRKVVKVG